eukprot:114195_1
MEAGTDSRANEMRHSPYPMIEMHEAMKSVLLQASPLPSTMVSLDCVRLGSVLAENVCATTDIPQFPTSIVDGYAVGAPCESGLYSVVGRLYTGTNPFDEDHPIQSTTFVFHATAAKVKKLLTAKYIAHHTPTVIYLRR